MAGLLGLGVVASTGANKPRLTGMPRPWFSEQEFAQAADHAHDTDPIEYRPRSSLRDPAAAIQALRDLPAQSAFGCLVSRRQASGFEETVLTLAADCRAAGAAPLPVGVWR